MFKSDTFSHSIGDTNYLKSTIVVVVMECKKMTCHWTKRDLDKIYYYYKSEGTCNTNISKGVNITRPLYGIQHPCMG